MCNFAEKSDKLILRLLFLIQFTVEPEFCRFPIRSTVLSETSKASAISSLLNPPKKRISTTFACRSSSFGEFFQSFVQNDDRIGTFFDRNLNIINRKMNLIISAFVCGVLAGVLNQNLPHQMRSDAVKMTTIFPFDARILHSVL